MHEVPLNMQKRPPIVYVTREKYAQLMRLDAECHRDMDAPDAERWREGVRQILGEKILSTLDIAVGFQIASFTVDEEKSV